MNTTFPNTFTPFGFTGYSPWHWTQFNTTSPQGFGYPSFHNGTGANGWWYGSGLGSSSPQAGNFSGPGTQNFGFNTAWSGWNSAPWNNPLHSNQHNTPWFGQNPVPANFGYAQPWANPFYTPVFFNQWQTPWFNTPNNWFNASSNWNTPWFQSTPSWNGTPFWSNSNWNAPNTWTPNTTNFNTTNTPTGYGYTTPFVNTGPTTAGCGGREAA